MEISMGAPARASGHSFWPSAAAHCHQFHGRRRARRPHMWKSDRQSRRDQRRAQNCGHRGTPRGGVQSFGWRRALPLSHRVFHQEDIFVGPGEVVLAAWTHQQVLFKFRTGRFGKAVEGILFGCIYRWVRIKQWMRVENQAILHRIWSRTGTPWFLSGKRSQKFSRKMYPMLDDSAFSCQVRQIEPLRGS